MLLTVLIHLGIITKAFIPASMEFSNFDMSRNLQDFLICFEMLLAAIAHTYVFSHTPYKDVTRGPNPMFYSLSRMIDLTDERSDVYDHLRHIRKYSAFKCSIGLLNLVVFSLGTRVRNMWNNPRTSYANIDTQSTPLIPLVERRTYGGTTSSETSIKHPPNLQLPHKHDYI